MSYRLQLQGFVLGLKLFSGTTSLKYLGLEKDIFCLSSLVHNTDQNPKPWGLLRGLVIQECHEFKTWCTREIHISLTGNILCHIKYEMFWSLRVCEGLSTHFHNKEAPV